MSAFGDMAEVDALLETSVDVIADPDAAADVMVHYANRCRRELLSVAPVRPSATRIDGRPRVVDGFPDRRGAMTRVLYQRAALRDDATRRYLQELAAEGARIGIVGSVPGLSLVVDRTVALLPIPARTPGRHGLAVVHDRNVVGWVVASFEQLWSEATPLQDVLTRRQLVEPAAGDTRAAILRMMAEGEKDEAIARRLSISVRTCRRHIADYMAEVGASSRFQAGVISARGGQHAPSSGR